MPKLLGLFRHALSASRRESKDLPRVPALLCYHFAMASLLIRNLDDAAVARLKERARQHNRSLQGEVKTILEAEARTAGQRSGKPGRRQLNIHTVNIPTRATWSRGEIYDDDGR
jgi:plasmid stability protein